MSTRARWAVAVLVLFVYLGFWVFGIVPVVCDAFFIPSLVLLLLLLQYFIRCRRPDLVARVLLMFVSLGSVLILSDLVLRLVGQELVHSRPEGLFFARRPQMPPRARRTGSW